MDEIFFGVSLFSFLSTTEQPVVFLQRGVARSLQLVFDLLAFRWPMLTLMDSVVWCRPFRLCWGCRVDWYRRCKENRHQSAPNSLNLNPTTSWTCWVFYFIVAGPNFVPDCCEWNRIVGRTSSHIPAKKHRRQSATMFVCVVQTYSLGLGIYRNSVFICHMTIRRPSVPSPELAE